MDKYHFVGIGGIGMSGLARFLLQKSQTVTGSDSRSSETLDNLRKMGAKVSIGHDKNHVAPESCVVISSDIASDNPEVMQAKALNLPILHRSDLLHLLMGGSKPLLIAGTHGKTTTTSLLTHVLLKAGFDPSYAIGGILHETGVNAAKGNGSYFVAEADESDGTFLRYAPYGAVITNIDNDHMNFYKTEENLKAAFFEFSEKVVNPDFLFFCGDEPLLKGMKGTSYGFSPSCKLVGSNFRQDGFSICFDVEFLGRKFKDVKASLIGRHNALNALAVFGMALKVGLSEEQIRLGLQTFQGVKRRQEKKGEIQNVQVIDDYGHHPSEIAATLSALRSARPNHRLIALFQPHRYSRTIDCLKQFGRCFDAADLVLVTDIYAAGEKKIEGLDAEKIVLEIQRESQVEVHFVPKSDLLERAHSIARPFDLFVTLGAGDITAEGPKLLQMLEKMPPKKYEIGVVFGGESKERDISFLSAQNVSSGIDGSAFNLHRFCISEDGVWTLGEVVNPPKSPCISADILNKLQGLDVVFPCLHGPFGEDGTMQGFLEILKIPYVGCSHTSSAICMDKALTKKLVQAKGLNVAPFIDFSLAEWEKNEALCLETMNSKLSFPLYIKPVHLGSSIGVKKVKTLPEARSAIEQAFTLDNHVLIEEEIKGREIEFALFGNGSVSVFAPGEVFVEGDLYDYAGKYSDKPMPTTPKAILDQATTEKGMNFAKDVYHAIGCDGLARVDCFLNQEGNFILNEVNPLPGFTKNSLYPKMCESGGIPLSSLLNTLILIGLARSRSQARRR